MKRITALNDLSRWVVRLGLALIGLATFSFARAEIVYFTQVGSGEAGTLAFRTLFQITNENDSAVAGAIELKRYDGQPLVAPVGSLWLNEEGAVEVQGGRVEFSIPPASSLQLTLNPGQSPLVGWAALESPARLAATALSQFARAVDASDPSGFEDKLESEVESVGTTGERSFSFPLTYRSGGRGIDTAFALVNLSDVSSAVTLLRRPDQKTELVLEPGESFSGYLSQVWPMAQGEPGRYDGLAEVRSESPLGFLVFRTLGGVPLSGVKPAVLEDLPADSVDAELGVEFVLAPRQSGDIEAEGLTVTFDGVLGDSRCPEDVTCVWAGEAIAAVSVSKDGAFLGQANLILPDVDRSSEDFGGYRVTAVRLDPYPNTENGPIGADDYRLTVMVERLPD